MLKFSIWKPSLQVWFLHDTIYGGKNMHSWTVRWDEAKNVLEFEFLKLRALSRSKFIMYTVYPSFRIVKYTFNVRVIYYEILFFIFQNNSIVTKNTTKGHGAPYFLEMSAELVPRLSAEVAGKSLNEKEINSFKK